MWSRPVPWPRGASVAAALAVCALVGCGGSAAKKPQTTLESPRFLHEIDPTDIFPDDLDLVVRIDVARMRAALGATAADALAARAVTGAGEAEVRSALACADVVWLAIRAAEAESGDHVAVFEGKECMPELARGKWQKVRTGNGKIAVFDRKGEAPRAGTARIINLGNRGVAFVSPVELDAVRRVLDAGPDARRGAPRAEGVVSVDLHARPLPPPLAKRFPSFGGVAAGVDRVRGSAVLVDEGLKIDAEIVSRNRASAEKARVFLEAIRDSAKASRYAALLASLSLEAIEASVRVKWVVPAKVVLGLLSDEADPPIAK